MVVRFRCPNCQARMGSPEQLIGEPVECPRCQSNLLVPDPTSRGDQQTNWLVADEAPIEFGRDRVRENVEMDMTPMVDVTFLLLIFFMVTAAFSLQKSLEVPTPDQTDEPSPYVVDQEESPDQVTVVIDQHDTFTVLTAEWQREAPGEIDLLRFLRESRVGDTAGIVPTQLLVKAHTECTHKRVVSALDAGSETGFDQVQLLTVDET